LLAAGYRALHNRPGLTETNKEANLNKHHVKGILCSCFGHISHMESIASNDATPAVRYLYDCCAVFSVHTELGRAGQGRAGQGRAGQGRAAQGL